MTDLTCDEFRELFRHVCTWDRWHERPEPGVLNHLTPRRGRRRCQAGSRRLHGRLGLPLNTRQGTDNPQPAVHRRTMLHDVDIGPGGDRFAKDYIGVDYLWLEDLAAQRAAAQRWEFFFVAAPLRVQGGTGSPVNPIAVF